MRAPRLAVALTGVLIAAGMMTAGPPGDLPASASPVTLVKCRVMQGPLVGPVQLSACNRPRITGGSGITNGMGDGPYPLTWSSLKVTNYSLVSSVSVGGTQTRCLDGAPELDFVGAISSVSGPWTKRFLGAPVTFDICLTEGIELVPGTEFVMTVPKP